MTCDRCGAPAQGRYCRDCGDMKHQEDYYGTVADDSPDVRDWGDRDDEKRCRECGSHSLVVKRDRELGNDWIARVVRCARCDSGGEIVKDGDGNEIRRIGPAVDEDEGSEAVEGVAGP